MKRKSLTSLSFALILLSLFTGVESARAAPLATRVLNVIREVQGGGTAAGNGGGVILCRNPGTRKIESVELVDLYEARKLRGLQIDLGSESQPWKEKVAGVIDRLGRLSQLRKEIYGRWLATFEAESMILTDIEFNRIPDSVFIGVPTGCEFAQAAVQKIPFFPGDSRYYLNAEIWNAMDDTQKAALVLHEIIYREALSYGHEDSVSTRYFLSQIASPKLSALDFGGFVALLKLVHFEQTDFPLPSFGYVTEFSPVNWWRGTFVRGLYGGITPTPPEAVRLKDRIVANVGRCRGENCTDWQTFPYFFGEADTQDLYTMCAGFSRMELGAVDAFDVDVPIYLPSEGKPIEHCSVTTRIHFLRDRLHIIASKDDAAEEFVDTAILKLASPGYDSSASVLEYGTGEKVGWEYIQSVYASHDSGWKVRSAYRRPEDSTSEPSTEGECEIGMYVEGNRLSTVTLFSPKCGNFFAEVERTTPHFTYRVIQKEDHGKIAFGPDGEFLGGGNVFELRSKEALLRCVSGSDCFPNFPAYTGPIPYLTATNAFEFTLRSAEGKLSFCEAKPGTVELWDGLTLKSAKLDKACTVGSGADRVNYPSDTFLRMNPNGQVTESL